MSKAASMAAGFSRALGLLISLASSAHAQAASSGSRQAAGLFVNACVRFAGDPARLRAFMDVRHVPQLDSQARAIFLRSHVGIVYDASNKAARLSLVSEDNGVCSVFAGQADRAAVAAMIEAAVAASGLSFAQTGVSQGHPGTSRYALKIKDHLHGVVLSSNPNPNAAIRVAITLTP